MRKLNFWDFPGNVQVHLNSEASAKYWEIVEEKAGSMQEVAEILGKYGLSVQTNQLYSIRKGCRSNKTKDTIEKPGLPIEYIKALENELGVPYKKLQDGIDFYSLGKRGKIIPEVDGERKMPIKFDEELLMALSAVMWSEIKVENVFTFTGPVEQRAWLYNTFKNHFGQIPECKKTCSDWKTYRAPKLTTYIGLDYLDKIIADFDYEESLAILLGSYAAKGRTSESVKRIEISSKKPDPLSRLRTALGNLDAKVNQRVHSGQITIYVQKSGLEHIYSEALEFCEAYDASAFLDPVLKYFKTVLSP